MPVIARVNGHARAGGLGIIAAADIAVAAAASTFAFTEVRVGVAPAMILVPALRVMDPRVLARLTLTGDRFSAAEAAAAGLLTTVVEDDTALDACVAALVDALRQAAPGAVRATKDLLRALPARAGPRAWARRRARRPSSSPDRRRRRGWRRSWRSAAPPGTPPRREHAAPVTPRHRGGRLPRERRGHARAHRRGARAARRGAGGRGSPVRRTPPRPRQDVGARAGGGTGGPRHADARAVLPGRTAHGGPGRRWRRRGAGRGVAHAVPHHGQRPHGPRGDHEPDDDPQAAAGHGSRRGEPPPRPAAHRVRRRGPATPGRHLRARRRAVPPAEPAQRGRGSRPSASCSARRRPAGPTSPA